MSYNELRKDYLLNRWVVIATSRSRRPTDFAKQRTQGAKTAGCPLCCGNEQMTPPANLLYLKENGGIIKSKDPSTGERAKNWLVRCIPNLYPAFTPPKQHEDTEHILKSQCLADAIGAHDVIVESPNHDEDPADAELPQLELLIQAYIDRLKEHSSKRYVKYVSIFRNYGQEAGASLSHAHSQVIATPLVPPAIQEEYDAAKAYHMEHGKCVFCDILKREAKGPRLVLENEGFVVFAPYASITPMTFWIAPKKHSANLLSMDPTEISLFAKTLKTSLSALKTVVNDPPYNYGFHIAIDKSMDEAFHWHLEVYPKLTIWAGFELNTQTYINTVPPEAAAESLRKTLNP
jgi:UDPglucose--hexose-1-phosphate uridylyltransferase